MAIDQAIIDAVANINTAFIENADWWPNDTVKLKNMIDAYSKALSIRPSLAAHGGSQAEEIRFNMEVSHTELQTLRNKYTSLTRASGSGSFRQHQLNKCHQRWPDYSPGIQKCRR